MEEDDEIEFQSLEEIPDTAIRELSNLRLRNLSGIERFPNLQCISNLFYLQDPSLEPLRRCSQLTHLRVLNSHIENLEPLSGLLALRELAVFTTAPKIDLSPLEALPALHDVAVRCQGQDAPGLEKLRSGLTSWDVEFWVKEPRFIPSLQVEIVDQATFDHYDYKEPYGLRESDTNEDLLSSEVGWIDGKLDDVLSVDFSEEDNNFIVPWQWQGGRSRTVVLYSPEAWAALPRLILGFQNVLAHCRNNWIIYLQSDETDSARDDFIVWVYPEKVQVTKKHLTRVRKLLKPR